MPRLSRGCLRCRQRKVRCDEGRPSCQRCIARNELCVGYRDASDIIFRHQTSKVVESHARGGQHLSFSSAARSGTLGFGDSESSFQVFSWAPSSSNHQQPSPANQQRPRSASIDFGLGGGDTEGGSQPVIAVPGSGTESPKLPSTPSRLSEASTLRISSSGLLPFDTLHAHQDYSWLKPSAQPPQPQPLSKAEQDAVQAFFAKYTLLPYDFYSEGSGDTGAGGKPRDNEGWTRLSDGGAQRASQGFLEFLPCTFEEVNVRGRFALRWAVTAAALADAASASLSSSRPPQSADNDGWQRDQTGLSDFDPVDGTSRSELGRRALEYYGKALTALAESLGRQGKPPDDYDLMTVVILDFFETLFLPDSVSRGCHAQGMSQILRRRGKEQFYDARGWSLFRLAHHRVQKQALAFRLPPCEDTDELLDQLNDELSFVKLEKDAYQITQLCTKARELRREVTTQSQHNHSTSAPASTSTSTSDSASASELIEIIRQLQKLDCEALAWRQGPEWSYATLRRADLLHGGANERVLASFPETVHIHPDIWTAYEWNYHHCSRIIMHKQILACLHRAAALSIANDAGHASNSVASLLTPLEMESITTIRELTTKILATVPQMLGDIDHTGCVRAEDAPAPRCRAIGAYFLLWPIKILMSDLSKEIIAEEQIEAAVAVFERIREYTGMRSLLGEQRV